MQIKPNNELPDPIVFVKDKIKVDQLIGVIGYPFQDPRGVTDKEMEKRNSGEILESKDTHLDKLLIQQIKLYGIFYTMLQLLGEIPVR